MTIEKSDYVTNRYFELVLCDPMDGILAFVSQELVPSIRPGLTGV